MMMKTRALIVSVLGISILIVSLALLIAPTGSAQEPVEGGPADLAAAHADAAADQSAQNIELISQFGGSMSGVAVQGNRAYVGVGPRLVVLDISNPARPTRVGQTPPLPGPVEGIYLVDRYAYVTGTGVSFRIIDIADPTTPVVVGTYEMQERDRIRDVHVVGQYAYVAGNRPGFRIVDISDPTVPKLMGTADGSSDFTSVHVAGHYAYLTDGNRLHVIDISDPTAPWWRKEYYLSGGAVDVYVVGNYAYLADGRGGLRILDISNPRAVMEVGVYNPPDESIRSVYAALPYAYVIGSQEGLRIVDVTDPANPVEVSVYELPESQRGFAVASAYVYFPSDKGLQVIDVSNPATPQLFGNFADMPGTVLDVQVVGRYAYAAAGEGGLRVIDISDPAAPMQVGAYPTSGKARAVAVAGRYAYVAETFMESGYWQQNRSSLGVVDVSDPTNPTEAGTLDIPGFVQAIYIAGRYAYVASTDLWILDISDPTAPVEVGTYTSAPGRFFDVHVAGSYAYAIEGPSASWYGRLRILDVSDPTMPIWVGDFRTGATFEGGVYVVPPYAYVTSRYGDLWVLNVADPAILEIMSALETQGSAEDVTVAGRYAYIADGNAGLTVVDVSDPTAPVVVGRYNTIGGVIDVDVIGSYVYGADGRGGLVVLRFPSSTSALIPPGGGSLRSMLDGTTYTFPAGVFTDTAIVAHTPIFPENAPTPGKLISIHHFAKVDAVSHNTGQPVQPTRPYTIIVHYTDAEEGPVIEDTLALYWWDGTQWIREPTSTVNIEANTVTATPDRFGLWAVLGETQRLFLPVILRGR